MLYISTADIFPNSFTLLGSRNIALLLTVQGMISAHVTPLRTGTEAVCEGRGGRGGRLMDPERRYTGDFQRDRVNEREGLGGKRGG